MSKIASVIQKMKNDKEYKRYFFRNSPKYQKLYLWLKPLYDEGYFNPNDIPKPIEDKRNKGYFTIPHWEVLDFLEAVATQNQKDERNEISELLLKTVNNIIVFQSDDSTRVDNDRVDWFIIKIVFLLPVEKIALEHIDFIHISMTKTKFSHRMIDSELGNIVLPVLLKNQMKEHLLRLLPIIFEYVVHEKEDGLLDERRKPIIEEFWLRRLLEEHSTKIANITSMDGLTLLLEHARKIIEEDEGSFNNFEIVTIEEHEQNRYSKYDYQVVTMIRCFLEEISPDELEDIVTKLLEEKHSLFIRFAIHAINYHYDDLKKIFWSWFNSNQHEYNSLHRHELFKLLSDRSSKFTEDEIDNIIYWVESLDYDKYYEDRTEEDREKVVAYKRKEWFLTIKDVSDKAKELFLKYDEISPGKIENPGFDFWMGEVQDIDTRKVFRDDNICEKSVEEIIKYIVEFDFEEIEKREEDPFVDKRHLKSGLRRELGLCIQKNPQVFLEKIELLDDLGKEFYYFIIDGFKNAWSERREFEWGKLFAFIDKILDEKMLISFEKDDISIKSQIAELIRYGTLSDDNAFDKKYMKQAKDIVFKLLIYRDTSKFNMEYLSHNFLNLYNGKVLHMLMSYTLRHGRLHSNKEVKWEDDVKSFFEQQIDRDDDYSYFVFSIFGEYISNFAYLDRQWLYDNFNKIFPLDKKHLWEVSIGSYYRHASTVYENVYNKLKEYGHLDEVLKNDDNKERIRERAIQHICVAYMNDFDTDTIFQRIDCKITEDIREIIQFVSRVYGNSEKCNVQYIYRLWEHIFEVYSDEYDERVFSTLSQWFKFIQEINKSNIKWFKTTAKYAEVDYNSYFIIQKLLDIVDRYPKYAGEIFFEMLSDDVSYPIFKQEEIQEIVEKLFKNNEIIMARKICNKYAQKGIYFLNEINNRYSA